TGRLREDYNIISPGDIKRAFIALANTSPVIKNLFDYRFQTGELEGHSFANLFIAALELSSNDYERTLKELNKLLNVKHQVLPATLTKSHLYAELENGKTIKGETNIDVPKHDDSLKIEKVYLKPKTKAYPESVKALMKSDLIVLGPGDLYSSLAQILLTKGISRAMRESDAKIVYICNLMRKKGETNNFNVKDFVDVIEKYLKGEVDYVIFNIQKPSKERIKKYKKRHPELLSLVQYEEELLKKDKYIGKKIIKNKGPIVHDPHKLSKIILQLLNNNEN
ncbi:MAG: gluconeogenesis factor YvcK family protein, partial [Minisyncoccales bacterium]